MRTAKNPVYPTHKLDASINDDTLPDNVESTDTQDTVHHIKHISAIVIK
jgi:hypothetical protein